MMPARMSRPGRPVSILFGKPEQYPEDIRKQLLNHNKERVGTSPDVSMELDWLFQHMVIGEKCHLGMWTPGHGFDRVLMVQCIKKNVYRVGLKTGDESVEWIPTIPKFITLEDLIHALVFQFFHKKLIEYGHPAWLSKADDLTLLWTGPEGFFPTRMPDPPTSETL